MLVDSSGGLFNVDVERERAVYGESEAGGSREGGETESGPS